MPTFAQNIQTRADEKARLHVRYDADEHKKITSIRTLHNGLMSAVRSLALDCQPGIEAALGEYHDALDGVLADELVGNALGLMENAEADEMAPEYPEAAE